jgi:phospholipid/cholesterol/gamma-HCH transport system substrate-binding protein
MSRRYLAVGIFIIAGVTLFALGIFLVGSRHEAFSRHVLLYTEFSDLDGIAKGSKVQVSGMDAGQVTKIDVPRSPSGQFRVQMKVDESLHGLVRADSVVTVDTEGVVGDTFLTIHSGSPNAAIAQADSVLQSKPPVSMSDLLTHGLGIMNDADATIKQVGGKLNVALDGVNGAVGNLPQKLDDTMTQIRSASNRAGETIQQVQQSLTQALGPDANGVTAGQNISEALTNVNAATGNMAEDTEALKHNFFFKGFFNRRGYYTLSSLSPEEYKRSKLFGNTQSSRAWLQADTLFRHGPHGTEELSTDGKRAIDTAVASFGDAIFTHPIVIEGYSDAAVSADALSWSSARAQLVRNYLEARYPFTSKNVGVMPLSATPPPGLGHDRWSGICILVAEKK